MSKMINQLCVIIRIIKVNDIHEIPRLNTLILLDHCSYKCLLTYLLSYRIIRWHTKVIHLL